MYFWIFRPALGSETRLFLSKTTTGLSQCTCHKGKDFTESTQQIKSTTTNSTTTSTTSTTINYYQYKRDHVDCYSRVLHHLILSRVGSHIPSTTSQRSFIIYFYQESGHIFHRLLLKHLSSFTIIKSRVTYSIDYYSKILHHQ